MKTMGWLFSLCHLLLSFFSMSQVMKDSSPLQRKRASYKTAESEKCVRVSLCERVCVCVCVCVCVEGVRGVSV